jgi:hypothetical protein
MAITKELAGTIFQRGLFTRYSGRMTVSFSRKRTSLPLNGLSIVTRVLNFPVYIATTSYLRISFLCVGSGHDEFP